MKKSEIEERTETLVLPILEQQHCWLWDVEYVKEGRDYFLRVYADKEGGLQIDDCVAISRALDQKLDEADFISDPYTLEVSSPGLTRKLVRPRDFEHSLGRTVTASLYTPVNGEKEITGTLQAYDKDTVTISRNGEDITLERSAISQIRLSFVE